MGEYYMVLEKAYALYNMVGYMISYSNPESYIPASYATAGSYTAG